MTILHLISVGDNFVHNYFCLVDSTKGEMYNLLNFHLRWTRVGCILALFTKWQSVKTSCIAYRLHGAITTHAEMIWSTQKAVCQLNASVAPFHTGNVNTRGYQSWCWVSEPNVNEHWENQIIRLIPYVMLFQTACLCASLAIWFISLHMWLTKM